MDEENDKIDSSEIAGRLRMTVGSPQYAKRQIIIPNRNQTEEVAVTELEDTETAELAVEEERAEPEVFSKPVPIQTASPTPKTEDLHELFNIERELPTGGSKAHKKGFISKIFGK
jgi:hypothetical protein